MTRQPGHQLPVMTAAIELGVAPGTLRRLCREGLPHTPGRRGRGCATTVDLSAARAWLAARQGSSSAAAEVELAHLLPSALASGIFEAWTLVADDPAKRRLAGVLAGAWHLATAACLARLRERCPSAPAGVTVPEPIQRLVKIARGD